MDINPVIKNDLKRITISFLIIMILLFMGSITISFLRGMSLQEAISDTVKRIFSLKVKI